MSFRFYVTDLFDGCIKGTNSEQVASDFASCEDYYVVDTETNQWLTSDGPQDIKEYIQ